MARHRATRAGTRRTIPAQNVVAWGTVAPWGDQRLVEQDLIISRALVEIFSDRTMCDPLRIRDGTAPNKEGLARAVSHQGRHGLEVGQATEADANARPEMGEKSSPHGPIGTAGSLIFRL